MEYFVAKDQTGDIHLYQGNPQAHHTGLYDPHARLEKGVAPETLAGLGLRRGEKCRVKISMERVPEKVWEWSADKEESDE